MTGAERQARRRERLRHNAEVDGLVEHVDRVLKQATAFERNWLLDQLVPLIEQWQDDRERADRAFTKKVRKMRVCSNGLIRSTPAISQGPPAKK
jgi:hypothetical protein